jgi:hypothetical protein
MHINLFSTLTLFALTLISCYSSRLEDKNALIFDKFPEEKQVSSDSSFKVNNVAVDGMLLYQDSLIILRNAANSSAYHFSLLNLKNKSSISSYLPSNRKPGGSLTFLSYGISNGHLWVNDIIKNKIIAGNIDTMMYDKSYTFQEIPMSLFYYSLQLMNNNEVIGFGDYDSDYKIGIYDLTKDKVAKHLLPYSSDSSRPIARGEKTEYESFLLLKPSTNDKCILACRYADRIEVVDLHTAQSKVVKGPENYNPTLSLAMGNDGKQLSVRNSETRYAFVKGKVTDKFIYLLYSGNNHESKFLNHGKYIYIYDWDGNAIRKLTMTDYIVDFAVSSDDKVLYSYNPKSKSIQISSL